MVAIELFVHADGYTGSGVLARGEAGEWKVASIDDVHDIAVRRHLMPIIVALRGEMMAAARVPLERLVGVAESYHYTEEPVPTVQLRYAVPTEEALKAQFREEAITAPPGWAQAGEGVSVARVQSHFGNIPLFPPLQVLCGARPFFTNTLLKMGKPLKDVLREWTSEGYKTSSTWHYARFVWNKPEVGKPWCKTYFYYSSPQATGPLNLYPLDMEPTLGCNPNAPTKPESWHLAQFTPHFVETVIDGAALPDDAFVIHVSDLNKEISEFLLHNGWKDFADVCQAHGLVAPTAEKILEIGFEKALIPMIHFMPLAPVVGFSYTHTFSAVPEPRTLCLTASAANLWMTPRVGGTRGKHMLEFAKACYEPRGDDPKRGTYNVLDIGAVQRVFDSIPKATVAELMRARTVGFVDDTPEGDFLMQTFNPAAAEYIQMHGLFEADWVPELAEMSRCRRNK